MKNFNKGDRVWFWRDRTRYGTVQSDKGDYSTVLLDNTGMCIDIENNQLRLLVGRWSTSSFGD